jgi:hypothetical protein
VIDLEPACAAAATPGLFNVMAWAPPIGAARMSNAPTAANPITFVTFM